MKKLPWISGVMLFLILLYFSQSCKKETPEVTPSLPAIESIVIDFSNFIRGTKGTSQKGIIDGNWQYASGVVSVWSLIIENTLGLPITVYEMAAAQTPVSKGNKSWQWDYNVTVASVVYKARLTGEVTSNNVSWKMYITRDGTGGFAEFMWFEGTSKSDGTQGQWLFKHSPDTPDSILHIDWTKSGSTIILVKYTYLKDGDSLKDSFIEYGLTSTELDAYYNIHYFNNVKFSDVNVEWNTSTHNGRVKCIDYLGDELWHCWNENLVDIDCL